LVKARNAQGWITPLPQERHQKQRGNLGQGSTIIERTKNVHRISPTTNPPKNENQLLKKMIKTPPNKFSGTDHSDAQRNPEIEKKKRKDTTTPTTITKPNLKTQNTFKERWKAEGGTKSARKGDSIKRTGQMGFTYKKKETQPLVKTKWQNQPKKPVEIKREGEGGVHLVEKK